MKIGILYIAIGRYDFFWKNFYESSERYFMQGYPCSREYFVFTDAPALFGEEENTCIHRIYQSDMGWPDNTMRRFHLFVSIREQLKELDYVFFFNANMEFVAPVGMEFLPTEPGSGLLGLLHGYYLKYPRWNFPYERRSASMAYIPYWKGKHYYAGGLIGGTTKAFLRMCEVCKSWIEKDGLNNIIPRWHDESITNRYFIDNQPKVLDDRYICWLEGDFSKENKIILRKKSNYLSFDDMKRPNFQTINSPQKQSYPIRAILYLLNLLFRIYLKIKN